MKPNRTLRAALWAGSLALGLPVSAQEVPRAPLPPPAIPAVPAPPVPPVPAWPFTAATGSDALMFVSSELGGRNVVSGAPYSATAISETIQMLTDGNRITRSTSTRLARDGRGRTRQEQGNGTVFIVDPVEGKRYVLNLPKKMVRELPLPTHSRHTPTTPVPPVPSAAGSAEDMRAHADDMRRWAQEFAARVRAEVGTPQVNVTVDRSSDPATPGAVTERVEIVRLGDARAPAPPIAPLPPLAAPSGPGITSPLGSRDFGGVRADGTRTLWTIPAGRIGNEKAIEVVSERWYSPELMLVVYSRHSDPRFGDRIYRLEQLRRGEPDAELFKVPADFELRKPAPTPPAAKK